MFDPGYAGTIFGIAATQSPPVSLLATSAGFTLNSNINPGTAVPVDLCVQNGTCTVPGFVFPTGSFTIKDLFCANATSTNSNCTGANAVVQQQADLYALPRRLRLPTVDAWNVAVQEQIDRHTYLEISYVANKGTHVLDDSSHQVPYYDLNQATLVGFIGTAAADNCQFARTIKDLNAAYCKTM